MRSVRIDTANAMSALKHDMSDNIGDPDWDYAVDAVWDPVDAIYDEMGDGPIRALRNMINSKGKNQ